ncbi:MAG: hydantoinase B/oxoprolinase family protein [Gracilimonas sp.]
MWNIYIDTGGTFTDCLGMDPMGKWHRTKILSSSALRGTIKKHFSDTTYEIEQNWNAPSSFISGMNLNVIEHDKSYTVTEFDAEKSTLKLDRQLNSKHKSITGLVFEIQFNEEPPILACRLLTQTPPGKPLPPIMLRLGTTRGTNALLEHKGAPTVLFTTKGFKDLPYIGNQQRNDLFSLHIHKPKPLCCEVVEVPERMDAGGNIISKMDSNFILDRIKSLGSENNFSAAICLMHSYKNNDHEKELAKILIENGFKYISISSELSPFIKILPRMQTSLVNAYLEPVLSEYLDKVKNAVNEGSIHVMTSAGGLVSAENFNSKDSLLSGPAGGVVGASAIGKESGFENIISFDMGGTSSDVARFDGKYDYVFEHQVGDATLAAPALAIETVASGGGSICSFDGQKLTVGPESAGSNPGPACYGAGGPLTITDVNLLLGRLIPDNFGIPVEIKAAEKKLSDIQDQVSKAGLYPDKNELLEGFLKIANERMAGAIRKISLQKGYDCTNYTLVAFGGAGGQHACSIARELGIKQVLLPTDAGILSAYGMGQASIERIAEYQVLAPLKQVIPQIDEIIQNLSMQALDYLNQESAGSEKKQVGRKLVFMRLEGQESTLEIEYESSEKLPQQFKNAYSKRYGHWIEGREIEVESVRVLASTVPDKPAKIKHSSAKSAPEPIGTNKVLFGIKLIETPVFNREDLEPGHTINGPALIPDPFGTVVLEPGWKAVSEPNGTIKLTAISEIQTRDTFQNEAVALELFTNRFTSVAEEMGEMLRRTALSVNVKERLDFSCAILNRDGELVVNAPHIPVHLGALGLCVRKLKETIAFRPGDVVITNHPAFGGSHLPDVTVVSPIFDNNKLLGFAANRSHHAEIGGSRPGSMPPHATTLAEEGVVIPPMYLFEKGESRWDEIRKHLTNAPYPTRAIDENMADLQAAVAANHRGIAALQDMAKNYGSDRILHYMDAIREHAAELMRMTLQQMEDTVLTSEEYLDDGTAVKVKINIKGDEAIVDFTGTSGIHPGNLNATPAIVQSVLMYVFRLLLDKPLPLNEGLLEPITIILPACFLNPEFPENPEECPAVVGGNIESSQRLVDTLLKPFNRIACSQGTMNNVLFGNQEFGYYETVGGGTGAGPDFDGTDAIHHHMTNTAATDPEILEHRYPVRLDRYAIRKDSGGKGSHKGGNGIIRELTFMEPVSLSVLSQHRSIGPYGLAGGKSGAPGKQWVIRNDGNEVELNSIDGAELEAGERFILHTPGGGGFGSE